MSLTSHGWYAGIDVGILRNVANIDAQIEQARTAPSVASESQDFNVDTHNEKLAGGFLGGYFLSWQKFRCNIEFLIDFAARRSKELRYSFNDNIGPGFAIYNFDSQTKIKLNTFQANIDLKPGFRLTPSADLYAIVGAGFNRIRGKLSGTFVFDSPGSFSAQVDKHHLGVLRWGVGLQEKIDNNLLVRFQYVFMRYKTLRVINQANRAIDVYLFTITEDGHLKLENWMATLGIVYRFPMASESVYRGRSHSYF